MKNITQIAPSTRMSNIHVDPQDQIGKVDKLHTIRENAVQTWYNHEVEAIVRPIWEKVRAKAHYDEYKYVYDSAVDENLRTLASLREMLTNAQEDPQDAHYYQCKMESVRAQIVRLGVQFASFSDTVSQEIEELSTPKILLATEEAVLIDLRIRMMNAGIKITPQNAIRSTYVRMQTATQFDVNNEVTDPTLP